ncbi:bsp6IM [Symbiodinium sp. CCMP2592]|nr:bsp6IM [Symbiodinium sp. CCMP2592]CAE7657727.1 bsp6IM [Symbiodinium sp. CCMP2592]
MLESGCWEIPASLPACRTSRITIGSCCSGWCSEVFAAQLLELHAREVFACESWGPASLLTAATHDHIYFFEDAFRDFMSAPTVDVFVAGAPCGPWSQAGLGHGFDDDDGLLIFPILRWIELRKPKVVILEQVDSLAKRHPEVLSLIIEVLRSFQGQAGQAEYQVSWQALNCRTHGFIPQNRGRLFIVAIRAQFAVQQMCWPGEVPAQPLSDFIDDDAGAGLLPFPGRMPGTATAKRNTRDIFEKVLLGGRDPLEVQLVMNVDGSQAHYNENYCPCLTRSRAAAGGFWLSWRQRRTSTAEICRLQGVDYDMLPEGVITQRQLRQIAGNAIPVPLLARVMQAALEAAGLVSLH